MFDINFFIIFVAVVTLKLGQPTNSQRLDVYSRLLHAGNSFLTVENVDHFADTLFGRLTCEVRNLTSDKGCNRKICYNISEILGQVSGNVSTTEVSREQLAHLSVLLIYYVGHIDSKCGTKMDATNTTVAAAHAYMTNMTATPHGIGDFLNSVRKHLAETNHNHTSEGSETNSLVLKEKCLSEDAISYYLMSDDRDIDQLATLLSYMIYADYEIEDKCRLLPDKDAFAAMLIKEFGDGSMINLEGLSKLMETLGILPTPHSTADESSHSHDRKKRSTTNGKLVSQNSNLRHRRQTGSAIKECFSPAQLMAIFNSQSGLNKTNFELLCPALINQKLYGTCSESTSVSNISDAEKFGYGTLAVFIICLCSVLGLIVVPCASKKVYNFILSSFLGLAVGTLFADAILHLIPMAMGIHDHGEEGHGHSHEDSDAIVVEEYVKYGLVIIGGLYLFYIIELLMENLGHHSHSHSEHDHSENSYQVTEISEGPDKLKTENDSHGIKTSKNGVTPLAVMIILGDGLHNLADGLAIGAAFSGSISVGVGTSIAVFCHELPHELGDFAVLIKSGMSIKKALGLNFLSALTAFIGLYVGIVVSANDVVRAWIFAITAGMFIYIALVDLMPLLIKSKHVLDLVLSNIGILTGFAIMLIIAIFEEHIKI
ncbi:zinc transporter ZIP4 [Biomphalaria pfeifferi]|uniref:Zinc transporter ZIP4 n=1 Tax=Biomphalaria pfeifferi TaxID=112525 RepID=A0AAD8FKN5_BIOPF|nr:zinc transporter ZIP4 [Biomphalaria pfeifferi]